MHQKLYPVILSGGSGTRLWPLSRAALPKQLLPLLTEQTLFQETVKRIVDLPNTAAPLIICNQEHRFMIAEQLRAMDVRPNAIVLEPTGRNTAPAIAIAALSIQQQDPDALMLVLPADHLIGDVAAFHLAVAHAAQIAALGYLATFGIVAKTPDTGFGYIRQGDALPGHTHGYQVREFVEKPDLATAGQYVASGEYYWNSGMFLFKVNDIIEELRRLRPDILDACSTALDQAKNDLDFIRLDPTAFTACPSESIDYAVMERTDKAAVVPADIQWNDIGAWNSIWEVSEKDAANNVIRGDVIIEDANHNLIRAESRLVVALGVENLMIIETADAILIAPRDRAQDVKLIVDKLKEQSRSEHLYHERVYRPWGWYEGIDAGSRFQVKRIMVKPGAKLSLQMHHHRAEHWVVVSGTAMVVRGEEEIMLCENQSTYIPLGSKHRLENPGKVPLHLIEVQSGTYLGEDDIVRYEDIYQRNA
ncbi:mannose-1-phosphate guanylyltransferase/mannose-6-phosphate isomerase [Sulfuriferula sp. AH1]|uniref:mannose-1-phosphate guanylyltransferase/mannose-6-phosphate isomerase n=1 Tax=Sulfuriferula sp. AH1 TaxID=1985873 RepID=UPI000B3B8B38|nr:mannose-1-phosphate guanylyltransferase/mannose-6-phosphate isomerase [Sulfuriferula sp. AH1]ARU32521.1 mannose-1-phosphate guanylyltransferase/mannose-6-phosphate isomerase [Sulfuriferula sp. AH1]